jgi:hypothetical protein
MSFVVEVIIIGGDLPSFLGASCSCNIVTFTVLETPFGLLLRFIYDFTSRHYNYLYNVTRTRLT